MGLAVEDPLGAGDCGSRPPREFDKDVGESWRYGRRDGESDDFDEVGDVCEVYSGSSVVGRKPG